MTLPDHFRLFEKLIDDVKTDPPHAPADREVPVEFYFDDRQFQRERDALFENRPLIIGHHNSIPEPGDHYIHHLPGAPLLIVRGRDNQVRVFLNVCRHRGVRLVREEGIQRGPTFTCPYHNWCYGLDGKLLKAPIAESFNPDDLKDRNLKELPSEVRHGFIWTQLDGGKFDLDDHLAGIGADFDHFEFAEQAVFRQTTSVKKTNWKAIVDAFQDGYHVIRLHKNSVGPFFIDGRGINERVGNHIRSVVARSEIEEILDAPADQWNDRLHVTFAYYLFPNSIIIMHPDYISHLGLFPKSPDETIVTHTCLIPELPKTQDEKDHWERAFDIIENGVFQAEDYFVCEQAQMGLRSGANTTHLLSGLEAGIATFHDIVNEAIEKT